MATPAAPIPITEETLRAWPLPQPDPQGDKNDRGRVLIIGGSTQTPGAVVLAAIAVLRSGAGRLQIATCRSIAPLVGVTVPESRVFGLPETTAGEIGAAAAEELAERANEAQCVLIGPGMIDEEAARRLLERLLPQREQGALVLDAAALAGAPRAPGQLGARKGQTILTPHIGEMASLLKIDKAEVTADPPGIARRAAAGMGVIIALKGAATSIAAPDGQCHQYLGGNVGLATSGSGDALSGLVAGLSARGASPLQAAAWATYLHGEAGNRLSQRIGRLGFLARELLEEIPRIMEALGPGRSATSRGEADRPGQDLA
jgi:ADP-dependent NAD(P)H-hydrate dehydratase